MTASLPAMADAGARTLATIGSAPAIGALVAPIAAGRGVLFAPRAVCIGDDDALWIADSGHHRVLGWPAVPRRCDEPAAVLLGQPDDIGEARNAGDALPRQLSLNLPVGLCRVGGGLLVCDTWNHRLLYWRSAPTRDRTPPDVVLGQSEFSGCAINRGRAGPAADSLYWPYGACWDGERLYVCDSGNRRLLAWDGMPLRNGQPADLVLGQASFECRDENGGHDADAASMRWPHAVVRWGDRLCVADAGNHRIMVWDRVPESPAQGADHLLGQSDAAANASNGGGLAPTAAVLNMPYALAVAGEQLWVADTANSRLLAWSADALATGAPADAVWGQPDFVQRGENRWAQPGADSLCWPYGLHGRGNRLLVADTGNQRVLVLELPA